MEGFIEITSLEQFDNATNTPSVFLFTADWCPDCVFIKPFISTLVKENPEFTYYVVNRDNFVDLCLNLDILGIPSFVAYNEGEEIGRFVSKLRKTKQEIQAFLDSIK